MTAAAPAPTTAPAPASPAPAPAAPAAPAAAPLSGSPASSGAAPPAEQSIVSLLYEDPAPAADGDKQAEGDAKDKPAPEPAPGDALAGEGEGEGENITTVAELIEQSQFDPEWFKSLKIDVKVDKHTTQVPISDLVKSYQINQAAEGRLEQAKTQAKALTEGLAAKTETLHGQLAALAQLVGEAEAELAAEFKGVDWAALKRKDPAKYAADKHDFDERQKRIDGIKAKGAGILSEAATTQHAEQQAAFKEHVIAQNEALLKAIPEWSDEKTRKAEKRQLVEYITGPAGFTKDQAQMITDHRVLVSLRKAMLFDALQDKTEVAKQKVVKIPKVLKPSAPAPATPPPKTQSAADLLYGS